MNTNTSMAVLALLILGIGCGKQPTKVESLRLDDHFGFHADPYHCDQAFGLMQPYRVGMSRDELRKILGTPQLVSSIARPPRGWHFLAKSDHEVGPLATEIERTHFNTAIVVCDVYNADWNWHILYFDDRGILVGFHRKPSVFCDSVAMR